MKYEPDRSSGGSFRWWNADRPYCTTDDASDLPSALWAELKGGLLHPNGIEYVEYGSRVSAMKALADAEASITGILYTLTRSDGVRVSGPDPALLPADLAVFPVKTPEQIVDGHAPCVTVTSGGYSASGVTLAAAVKTLSDLILAGD